MSAALHEATDAEAEAIWPAARAAHLFGTADEFRAWRDREPWRLRVDERGDAAVLVRWRSHLDALAIRALWCPPRRVGELLGDLRGVALDRGFGPLVSPLLAEEVARPYLRAGMQVRERLVAIRGVPSAIARAAAPAGVVIRRAAIEECEAIAAVEAASFDDFWRQAADDLRRDFARGRVVVACEGPTVVGYTLTSISYGNVTLGRLAVGPGARRRGIGRALLSDVAEHAAHHGASAVTLCTQKGNTASRALYAACGFRELPGALVIAMDD